MDLSFLPATNACLNAGALLLLVVGRLQIRRGRVAAHRRAMLSAFGLSSLFLVLYVAHKAWRGFEHTPYRGGGGLHLLYLGILATHVVLAMAVPVLALRLVQLAVSGRIAGHRRLARVAWPIWVYVSVTGVVIYLMLYPLNPPPA